MAGAKKEEKTNQEPAPKIKEGEEDEGKIVIPEEAPVPAGPEKFTEEQLRTGGWKDGEIEKARKQGRIKTAEEIKKEKDEEAEKTAETEKEKKETEARKQHERKNPLTEEEKKTLDGLDKKGQAFYFQMRDERHKRQETENRFRQAEEEKKDSNKKLDDLQKQLDELNKKLSKKAKGRDLLEDEEEEEENRDDKGKPLTEERLLEIEKEKEEKAKKEKEQKEKEEKEAGEIKARGDSLEAEAKKTDPKFDDAIECARQVMEADDTGIYAQHYLAAVYSKDPKPGKDVISVIYKLASFHPDYKGKGAPAKAGEEEGEEDEGTEADKAKAARLIENSGRRSSAGKAGGGGKGTVIDEEDLTSDDAKKLTRQQYSRLKPETKRRLKGG